MQRLKISTQPLLEELIFNWGVGRRAEIQKTHRGRIKASNAAFMLHSAMFRPQQ